MFKHVMQTELKLIFLENYIMILECILLRELHNHGICIIHFIIIISHQAVFH